MKQNLFFTLAIAGILAAAPKLSAQDEAGFKPLMDGITFNGWKKAEEHPDTWKIEEGAFVAHGDRCHLFYTGDEKPFKNFHLKVDVMTEPNSNGGIYFHTKYQESDWPKAGFECQVNNTHSDWKKTGSLYNVVNTGVSQAQDKKWWTQEIIVEGRKITVKIDGKTVIEYTEPLGSEPGKPFANKLSEGTFGLQAHDPKSVVRYKNIRVKRLD
jgi:hypothetical protein